MNIEEDSKERLTIKTKDDNDEKLAVKQSHELLNRKFKPVKVTQI